VLQGLAQGLRKGNRLGGSETPMQGTARNTQKAAPKGGLPHPWRGSIGSNDAAGADQYLTVAESRKRRPI
jgi:hypothetical protein